MKVKKDYLGFVAAILVSLLMTGCTVTYSFTGASIPPEVKTINIKYFPNNASLVEPTLSQKLTDALRDKFSSETNLTIVNGDADLILEGSITNYTTQPVAIQQDDQAALNRLTITIEATYTNKFDKKMSFETTFSRFAEYSSSQNLSDVEEGLIEEINVMLVEDVFNKAVINW